MANQGSSWNWTPGLVNSRTVFIPLHIYLEWFSFYKCNDLGKEGDITGKTHLLDPDIHSLLCCFLSETPELIHIAGNMNVYNRQAFHQTLTGANLTLATHTSHSISLPYRAARIQKHKVPKKGTIF